jgi:hypothetical protein
MIHIVTSFDGVQFVTNSSPKSVAFDRLYASKWMASELEKQGGFIRLKSLDDLAAGPYDIEFVQVPRIAGPLERRAAFRVIKGGKP